MAREAHYEKTTYYVKTFLRYYRVTKYGNIAFNSTIFITPTPEKIWYTIEPASGREAEGGGDLRGPDELVVYGRRLPCSKLSFGLFGLEVMFEDDVRKKLAHALGRNAVLVAPRKPMKLPNSRRIRSEYLAELAKISMSPARLAIFDGSPSKPQSVFKIKPRCLAPFMAALDVIKAAGIGGD